MRLGETLRLSPFITLEAFVVSIFILAGIAATSVSAMSSLAGTPSRTLAGYLGGPVPSGEVTRLHADWNISPLTCQTSLSGGQGLAVVIEMKDSASGNVLQVSTRSICDTGISTPSYTAFVWLSGIGWFKQLPITISGGDNLSVTVNLNPATNKTIINFTDTTTSQTLTVGKVVSHTYPDTANVFVGLAPGLKFLPEFSTPITFSGITLIDSGTKLTFAQLSLTQYYLVDSKNHLMAHTSPLSASGKAFHVTFVRSS